MVVERKSRISEQFMLRNLSAYYLFFSTPFPDSPVTLLAVCVTDGRDCVVADQQSRFEENKEVGTLRKI